MFLHGYRDDERATLCRQYTHGEAMTTRVESFVMCVACQKAIMAFYKRRYPEACRWTPWDPVAVGQRVKCGVYTGEVLESVNNGFASSIEGFWRIKLDKPLRVGGWTMPCLCFPAPALESIE